MISDVNSFSFVAESLGGVFDCLIRLADAHSLEHVCIRGVSGYQVVRVTTNADTDCVFKAIAEMGDDVMHVSLRRLPLVGDVSE